MPDPCIWLVMPWSPSHQGGVTGVVQNLCSGLSARRHARAQIVVNEWSAPSPRRGDDRVLRFRFQALVLDSWRGVLASLLRLPLTLWRARQLLHRHNVVAVNFHYTDHSPALLLLLRRLGMYRGRVLVSFHGTDVKLAKSRPARWLHREVLQRADALVACSHSLADRLATTFALDRSHIHVVFNGADLAVFRPDAPMTPRLAGRLPRRYIVSVGAFIPRKAHTTVLDAFARYAAHDADMHLCLAGAEGSDLAVVQAHIESSGLQDRVHLFVGIAPPDVAALLARARLCVQAALAESFPLAVLEAGAVGTPVAASDIPGHDELVLEGVTGRLFPPGDPAACALVIARMLSDGDATQAMATSLSRRVRSELSWDRCVEQYQALLLGPEGLPPTGD